MPISNDSSSAERAHTENKNTTQILKSVLKFQRDKALLYRFSLLCESKENQPDWSSLHDEILSRMEPSTPKWQEQLEALECGSTRLWHISTYISTRSGLREWDVWEDNLDRSDPHVIQSFTADTPEAAIDAAYQSVIGSGVQS